MDLTKLDTSSAADEGADLQLLNPVDDTVLRDEKTGEPVSIQLLGSDSKEFMRISHKLQDKRLQKRFTRGKLKMSAAEIEADALDLLVACTKGWKHVRIGQEVLPFNEENVRMVYNRFPWIKEQVDSFVNDRASFLGES